MKKRDRKKLNDKIILFPDLEKRLLEKGLQSLHERKFLAAIDFLEGALEFEQENHEIHIGLVIAYFESGQLIKAKELAKNMLQKGVGDYFQIIDLYLMILVQLHQYDEIAKTIEVLIEEREIPSDKYEHFTRLLEFSKRMAESGEESIPEVPFEEDVPNLEIDLFSIHDQHEQIQIATQLIKRNIRPYLDEILSYLASTEGQPFFKTMLLNVLTEHEYDKKVIVQKLGEKVSVRPSELESVGQNEQMRKLLEIVSNELEHEDPILFEHIKNLIERHLFILYPFKLPHFNEKVWSAAYHNLAAAYQGVPVSKRELLNRYEVLEKEMNEAGEFLKKIEEISSSNY